MRSPSIRSRPLTIHFEALFHVEQENSSTERGLSVTVDPSPRRGTAFSTGITRGATAEKKLSGERWLVVLIAADGREVLVPSAFGTAQRAVAHVVSGIVTNSATPAHIDKTGFIVAASAKIKGHNLRFVPQV